MVNDAAQHPLAGGELVPSGPAVSAVLPAAALAPNPVAALWSNLRTETAADKVALVNALNGAALPLDSLQGETLHVCGVTCYPVDIEDTDTGEIQSKIRTVLSLDDGRSAYTYSDTFRGCLGRILSIIGPGPWESPLAIIAKQYRNSRSRNVWSVRVV